MYTDHRAPLIVSGIIFSLLALFHLLRLISGWGFVIGTVTIPLWWSWIGLIITVLLAIWVFKSAYCERCIRGDKEL